MDDDVFDQYEGMYNPYEREFDDQSHFEVRLRFSRFFLPDQKIGQMTLSRTYR